MHQEKFLEVTHLAVKWVGTSTDFPTFSKKEKR
jgi:hypothetical protein